MLDGADANFLADWVEAAALEEGLVRAVAKDRCLRRAPRLR